MSTTATSTTTDTVKKPLAQPEEQHKKRKITYTKPSVPPRAIEPFNEGLTGDKKIYPFSNYTINSKKDKLFQEHEQKEDQAENEARTQSKPYKRKIFKSDQIPNNKSYFKSLKNYNDHYGTRRFLQFLIVVGGDKEPIVLLLKDHNELLVPGGYLNHDETEKEGGERILRELFEEEGSTATESTSQLTIGETVARWWRTDLKPYVYPYLPRHVTRPKELIKVVYVNLPSSKKLSYPEFYKNITPFPLVDLYDKPEPELKSIPLFLSKILFTFIDNGKEHKDFSEQYSSITIDQPPPRPTSN